MCKKPKKIVKEVTRPFKQAVAFVEDSVDYVGEKIEDTVDYVGEQVEDAVDFVTEDIPEAVGISAPDPAPMSTPDPAPARAQNVEEEDPKKKKKKKLALIQQGTKKYRNTTPETKSVNVGGLSGINVSKG